MNELDKKRPLPLSLYAKSALVASPLERFAKHIQNLGRVTGAFLCPDLTDIFLEAKRTELALITLLKSDSCAVDVGCHIGSFLSDVLRLAPGGSHCAVEASPQKAELLKRKFSTVEIMNFAVGSVNGSATFFEDRTRPGFSRLHRAASKHHTSYEVQVRTLDTLLCNKPRIDLVKLDIEGGELEALRGAVDTIGKHRPILLFECGAENELEDLRISRRELFDLIALDFKYEVLTFPDFLHDKGPLSFDEFRKCGIYPFRAFNFLGIPAESAARRCLEKSS